MSQAFVKESEEQWLHEVQPSINALIIYLTRENNGIRVYEKKNYLDTQLNTQAYLISNGLAYAKDKEGKWFIV